ncbi:MAG: hypothetical protein E3J72_05700 [Planctomycetota bacterium]|nr:MAG: hypothetical protein E3J72_05700 [Planctomycetota bacterium]
MSDKSYVMPVEKRFAILCQIARAQHFAWYQAVKDMCPDVNAGDVANHMWELSGHETAKAYIKQLRKAGELEPKAVLQKLAESFAWSSQIMGEEANVKIDDDGTSYCIHDECPWYDWHKRLGILEEDQPGCDIWFKTVVADVNAALGTDVKIETTESLPAGGNTCTRKIYL